MARKRVVFFRGVKSFLVPFLKPLILAVLVFSLIVGFGERSPLLANQYADKETEAAALITDGKILLEKGMAEAALARWEAAENIYLEIGNYEGIIGSQLNQGQALEAMGFTRDSCDIILTTFPGLEVDKCDGLNDGNIKGVINAIIYQPSPFNWMGLESLGNRLRLLGNLEKSELVLEAVRKLAPERASIYLSLGNTARDLANLAKIRGENQELNNQKEEAIDYYKEAIALADGNLIGLQARLNWLSLLRDFKANQPGELIQEIDRQISDLFIGNDSPSRELVSALVNYAVTVKDIDKNKAIALLKEGINLAEELENLRLLSFAKGILGEVESNQKQLEEALTIALKIDAEDIAYRWEWQIGKILKERGDREGAIAYYRPAFSILKKLRGNLVALNRDSQFNFRDEIEDFYIEYADLLLQPESEGMPPKQENIREARQVIEALQLAELDNFFREACVLVKEENLDTIVDESDPPTALIYPIAFDNRLDVIVKLPEPNRATQKPQLLYVSNPVSEEEFTNTINGVLQEIQQPRPTQRGRELSIKLYGWLVQEFEDEFQSNSVQTLVFVLDSLLQKIPMAVLYDGEQYLFQKYNLSLNLGLQLKEHNPQEKKLLKTLAAGASEEREIEGQTVRRLDKVPEELDKVEALLDAEIISETGFTKSQLQELMRSGFFSVVHLATHGQFSSDRESTYLVTWDERLRIDEIQNLLQPSSQRDFQNVDLLVLTACETAKNDPRAALGMAGVAVSAGASSTIASLWQLGDLEAVLFVEEFYKQLIQNPKMTKAEAVRLAQEKVLQQRRAPFHWAPFVLIGDWQ